MNNYFMQPHTPRQNLISHYYQAHYAWLNAWLRKKLRCAHDAADLTHDTFIRMLHKPELEQLAEPRAYLTTIAHGLMVSHLRRRDLEKAYHEALSHLPPNAVPSAEASAILYEALLNLAEMLDGLKPNERNAYLMLQLEGLSYAEIGQKLGVSTRTVTSYIAKAALHCALFKQNHGL